MPVWRRRYDTDQAGDIGMRIMFWTWMILIAAGLAVTIALPLLGR